MTLLAEPPAGRTVGPAGPVLVQPGRRLTGVLLAGIAAVQIVLAHRPGLNGNAFQDEGLYLFMGHRMIEQLTTGAVVQENPGSYFSGAPGLYPVLAAVSDSLGGLAGARLLSLFFAILAMIATFGLADQLFSRSAGLLAAATFAVCGSVIFQSHLATYDAMAMSLFGCAAWLTVWSVKRNAFLYGPAVALLLAVAFLVKYATAVYVPGIALLAIAVGWRDHRWTVVVRAVTMVLTTVVVVLFVVHSWGAAIVPGIVSTTSDRIVLAPASAADLVLSVLYWVGPWLALAGLGALGVRRDWRISLVLLGCAIAGPVQQIRIGESTSLAKHVAFGMVFACPLVGSLLSRCWRWHSGKVLATVVIAGLGFSGLHYSGDFLTGWVDDRDLVPVLTATIAMSPGKVVLGEEPSAQRYELMAATTPAMWADTFEFYYAGLQGMPAYRLAIDQSHFGTIYLSLTTSNGRQINDYLTTGQTPYRLSAKVAGQRPGGPAGEWLIWTPSVLAGPGAR